MMTIRTLTDTLGGEYVGAPVPIRCGICVNDLEKTTTSSYQRLGYFRARFKTDGEFFMFVQDIIRKPTGTALEGQLTWQT